MVVLKWIVIRLVFKYGCRGLSIGTTDSNDLMLSRDQVVIVAPNTVGINVFIHHYLHTTSQSGLSYSLQQMFLVAHQKIGLLLQHLELFCMAWASLLRFAALINHVTAFVT